TEHLDSETPADGDGKRGTFTDEEEDPRTEQTYAHASHIHTPPSHAIHVSEGSTVAQAMILKRPPPNAQTRPRRLMKTDELMRVDPRSVSTENDWWARMVDSRPDELELEEEPSFDLSISVIEDDVDLEEGNKTAPGLWVDKGDGLLWTLLSSARETTGVHCLELVDVAGRPFAEMIVVDGRIHCGIFFDGQLLLEDSEELSPSLRAKLQAMASTTFEESPWRNAPAWDWELFQLEPYQRRVLSQLTAQALTRVTQSPRAVEASIRFRPLETPFNTLLCFSTLELSLALESFMDLASRDEPAWRFYHDYARRSLGGGLLRRDAHIPGALRPIMMVSPESELSYRDKRTLQLAVEELLMLHTQLGLNNHNHFFQVSHTTQGEFWALLASPTRVAMLCFPSALMGLICGNASRLLATFYAPEGVHL
ncbi:MAG: hypothetical protein AAFX99_02885, partial [Myxococcota bacterium]